MIPKEMLELIVDAYDRGRLVPFIGSGLSREACASWRDLIQGLYREAHEELPERWDPTEEELVQAAHRAVTLLKRRHGPGAFASKVNAALYADTSDIPAQTVALCKTYWPLVISTNYDDLYCRANLKYQIDKNRRNRTKDEIEFVEVRGRAESDCQRVLAHVAFPVRRMLWAIQGFLTTDTFWKMVDEDVRSLAKHWTADFETWLRNLRQEYERLESELVIGHAEYRRLTHRIPHFRRAFAEVFRSHSLLFVGSGLGDRYLLELFGEVVEMVGHSPHPHFAVIEEGRIDRDFLLDRYNIRAIEYPKRKSKKDAHGDVPTILEELAAAIRGSRARSEQQTHDLAATSWIEEEEEKKTTITLGVVRSLLVQPKAAEHCVAISVGRDDHFKPAPQPLVGRMTEFLAKAGADPARYKWVDEQTPFVCRFLAKHEGVYGIAARSLGAGSSRDRRELTVIGTAFRAFLDHISARHSSASVMLLAAGPHRVFPAAYSFMEMVRTYRDWNRERSGKERLTRLDIHVIAPDVIALLTSGRLDVNGLLNCSEIGINADVQGEQRTVYRLTSATLGEVCAQLLIPHAGWSVEILPHPALSYVSSAVGDVSDVSLRNLGVVQGSTLRFVRLHGESGERA